MKKQLLLVMAAAICMPSMFGRMYHWRVRNSTGSKLKATWSIGTKQIPVSKTKTIKPGESKVWEPHGFHKGLRIDGLCLVKIHVVGKDGMALGETYDWKGSPSRCKSGVLEIYIPNESSLKPVWQEHMQQTSAGAGGQAQSTTVVVGDAAGGSSQVDRAEYLKKNIKLKGRWVD